jgi:hypothetical protein
MKPTGTCKTFKRQIEVTPLQEKLLDFFDFNGEPQSEIRLKSFEWIFTNMIFGYEAVLTIDDRMHLFELNELIGILKSIKEGY